ncbi:DSHCT domain protein [Oesophagostomum dentatum]|uniref:DSHCT domain protein n=1 Tax=Oesophagostomum dentatum TaxID=61180 RepID=A0A0B1THH7_OESDE|nr:DSHCT domain protein [Oesophagostomum dentatum]
MKLIYEMDSLTEEWSSSGPQLYDLTSDVKDMDFELSDQLLRFLNLREEVADPKRHTMKNLRDRVRIERQISKLKYSLSVEALQLSDEYQNRIEVLKELGYVDRTGMVTFKGRVACEIHHQELLITELILSKKLHERSPAEVAAMLSATTCQYKAGDGPKFAPDSVFEQLKNDVQTTNGKIESVASSKRVHKDDVGDELRYDLMQVVYHWAGGMVCFCRMLLKHF